MSHECEENGAASCPLPDGEYAIVECLGHRTLIGRVVEVERFGAKLCQVEPIFGDRLLEPVFVAGSSLYAFTPCSRETAWKKRATAEYQLPAPLRARLDLPALAGPSGDHATSERDEDDDEVDF